MRWLCSVCLRIDLTEIKPMSVALWAVGDGKLLPVPRTGTDTMQRPSCGCAMQRVSTRT